MRILVTEQGGSLIKALSSDKTRIERKKLHTPKKKPNEQEKTNIKDNMENLRFLEIKNKKLSIPKDIQEKYNEVKLEEISLLPSLYTNIKKSPKSERPIPTNSEDTNTVSTRENTIEGSSTISKKTHNPMNYSIQSEPFLQTSYRVKDVISDDALYNMKNNIINEVNLKNRLASVVSTNFRSPFLTPLQKLNEIDVLLTTKIKSDKANIIQYLNSKNSLSPKLVKSIAQYDEEKFVRLNKICQRVFNKNIEESDMKYRINGKIENIHQNQKADYKIKMKSMEKEVKKLRQICEKYPTKDDREKYENLLYDVKKNYWDKRNLERLMKRGKNLKTEI